MHMQFIKTLVSLQRTVSIKKINDLQVYYAFLWKEMTCRFTMLSWGEKIVQIFIENQSLRKEFTK